MDYIEKARTVIETEINGLATIKENLGEPFVKLVELSLKTLKNGGKINRVEVWCQYRRRTYSLSQTCPKLIWIVGIIIVKLVSNFE